MKLIGLLALFVVALAALVLIAGQLGLLAGTAPDNLGVHDGRLKPPANSPNSVSSQADLYPDHPQRAYSQIAPFKFAGDGKAAMQRLAQLLRTSERTALVKQEPGYLYAQSRTALLKFTDDVEFYLDEGAGVIHVRSSSRLGRKDFGVNRDRIEALRARFQQ